MHRACTSGTCSVFLTARSLCHKHRKLPPGSLVSRCKRSTRHVRHLHGATQRSVFFWVARLLLLLFFCFLGFFLASFSIFLTARLSLLILYCHNCDCGLVSQCKRSIRYGRHQHGATQRSVFFWVARLLLLLFFDFLCLFLASVAIFLTARLSLSPQTATGVSRQWV